MTDKEAMKLALFALDIVKTHYTQSRHVNEAITALKERLAQEKALQALHDENERLGLYRDAYAQPEQEPVAILNHAHGVHTFRNVNLKGLPDGEYLVYTHPPQRTEQEPLIGCVNHDCDKCKLLKDERLELIGHADLAINNIYIFNGYGEDVPEDRTPIYAGYKAAHGIKETT